VNAPNGAPRTPPASAAPALAAASAAALAAGIDRAAIASVVESLRADLWLTDARLGGLVAAAAIAAVALAPGFASLARRRPASRVLALGVAISAAGTMLSGAAWRGLALLAARIATGAGPAARAAAAPALAPDGACARGATSTWAAPPVAGAAAGYALGAVLSRLLGWRWALVVAGAPGLLAALACLRAGRDRAGPAAAPPPWGGEGGLLAELRRLRADRERLLAAVAHGAATFAASAMAFWTPAFLERTRAVPRAAAGVGFGVVVLIGAAGGTFAAARALARLRARTGAAERWIAGAGALAATPLALAAYVAWRPRAYLVSLVLAQVLLFAAARAGAAAVAASAPGPGAPAAAAAAIVLLAEALAPPAVGLLSDRTSLSRALAVLVPLALALSAAAWIAAARHADRAGRGPAGPRP
jgi:MFS family permease